MFVFCLFVYFLSGYLQVGIDKGERSVTVWVCLSSVFSVCMFVLFCLSVCLSTSSLATSRWV